MNKNNKNNIQNKWKKYGKFQREKSKNFKARNRPKSRKPKSRGFTVNYFFPRKLRQKKMEQFFCECCYKLFEETNFLEKFMKQDCSSQR